MALPPLGQTPPSDRTPEEVEAELREVAQQLGIHVPIVKALYSRRDELYVEGREGFDPPMTQKRIADASDVTDQAVIASMRKINQQRAQAAQAAATEEQS